ncbi:unnamed protein product [Effrenium voratum]|uniref:MYND-type domain-containing protein n=1 Tax=Effrenium voratum TaxID=2562239 RepID=A0AA36I4D4_9DINO|nr:unnamed protein product [Effrenium voratum]
MRTWDAYSQEKCDLCGEKASAACSKCRSCRYCSPACQRRHWATDHKHRCRLAGSLLTARRQLQRGDFAFSLQTAEEAMKAHAGAIKAEADKEYAFDADMVRALARGLSLATVCVAEALASDQELAKHKFCRACFAAVATLLDVAAALREERCPPQLWKPVQAIAEGQEGHLSGGGDPVLSAWMMYDSYAKGLADRPSAYEHNLPRMRIAALLALKDAAAAAVAMLQGDSSFADISAAGAVDAILDTQHLKACRDDIAPLREFYPQGLAGEEEDDTIEPWHKF